MDELVPILVRFPRRMRDAILEAIKRGYYMNTSEFVRNAVRKELERLSEAEVGVRRDD